MRKLLLLMFSSLFIAATAARAQKRTNFDIDKLHITWELLQNSYEGKNNQFLAQLTIHNTSKTTAFPAKNWEMYFNYPREVIRVIAGEVSFKFLQGDFSKMQPKENFKQILPGASEVIQFVAKGFTQNTTDAISGLYFVIGKEAIPVKNFTVKPILKSGVANLTAAALFKKYESTVSLKDTLYGVFPSPVKSIMGVGSFTIHSKIKINADSAFFSEASLLADDFKTIFGKSTYSTKGQGDIVLQKVAGLGKEAYDLNISPSGILIKASHPAGAFYAVKSLTNLFPAVAWRGKSKPFKLRAIEVKDEPRFAYRAFMMDVARNFQSKEQVKKVIDLMSLYKLNSLHFHLNDDEGWRLQIPSLPELTQVGAKRAHTFTDENLQPSYGSGPDSSNKAGSGFYSDADFIDILKYAAKRHIKVIPEIETPGHARAAIKAMNYRYHRLMKLGDKQAAEAYLLVEPDDQSKHKSVQAFTDNIINVALPSTYRFIETVLDDLTNMYSKAGLKLETVHMGGDEVPKGSWEKSKAALAMVSKKEVGSIDELWYYYYSKVIKIFKNRGLQLAGWEEIAMRKTLVDGKAKHVVNPDFVNENIKVYVWNTGFGRGNEDLAYKLANAGYKTVLGTVSNFYFDLAYSKDNDESGLYWGGYVDVDKPFYFVPFDQYKTAKENYLGQPIAKETLIGKERLTDFGKSNIVGIQALLWSEKVTTAERLEYMLFPKLLGFAERAWAPSPNWAENSNEKESEKEYTKAWSFFANTLGHKELPKLDFYNGGVAYRIPPVGLLKVGNKVKANVQFPGLQIRYTTDGTTPTSKSKLYEAEIPYIKGLKFKAFSTNGRFSKTSTIN